MKRVTTILSATGLLVLALSMPSWAQVRQQTQTINLSGTVESIDRNQRVVHIRTDDGKFETIDVPQSAKRFDELKVGDKVSITYNNTVTARLKPPGEAPVGTEKTGSTMGQQARPGGATTVQETITATCQRYRQKRIVNQLRWAERLEIQPTCRRSDDAR
jgi:ribosomal protein L2